MEQHGGSMSVSEGSPKQPKSRSGPEFLGLSRCAGCYNQKASSMPRWGGDGESSSSAEDSGPEVDCESESESTSSSSCSGPVEAETPETERSSPVCGGEDGAGREETGETSSQRQQDENKKRRMIQRAPLVKSFSLPSSFTPNLTPLSFLPRPPGVVSTLHLEVLPEKHSDNTFVTIRRHLSERENTGGGGAGGAGAAGGAGGGGGGGGGLQSFNNPLLPQPSQCQQTGLPWQQRSQPTLQQHQYQQMIYQYHQQQQQQQQQQFPLFSAQGQRSHTLPMLHRPTLHTHLRAPHAPQTHLHTLTPQPCWYCYQTHLPYTYWSDYSSGQFPR